MSLEEKEDLAKQEKGKGNRAFQDKNYAVAVKHFSVCITLDPENHDVYYSNRSAAYTSMKEFECAVSDAQKAIELRPDWPKAYARLGAACMGMESFMEAKTAYEKAFELEPTNASYEAYANQSIVASVCSAEQCEVKAREEGKITFRKKQKLGVCVPGINVASTDEEATDVGRRSAHSKVKGKVFTDSKVQRAGAVNNKKLLSFCEDED